MNRAHTPLSMLLGIAGMASIVVLIFVPRLLPAPFSSLLDSLGFFISVGLIFGSLKTMRPIDKTRLAPPSKKEKMIGYAATYTRLIAGLMILAAFVVFSAGWRIADLHSAYGMGFLISILVVSAAALVLTALNWRLKSGKV